MEELRATLASLRAMQSEGLLEADESATGVDTTSQTGAQGGGGGGTISGRDAVLNVLG